MKFSLFARTITTLGCVYGAFLSYALAPAVARANWPVLRVSTIQELVTAIGSQRQIELAPGIYHLSADLPQSPFISWGTAEAPALTINGVHNLLITGQNAKNTQLASTRCSGSVLDFKASQGIQIRGVGFARMLQNQNQALDCDLGLRGRMLQSAEALKLAPARVNQWQQLAKQIIHQRQAGIELPEMTAPLYPDLLEQVRAQSQWLAPERDRLSPRQHAIRPRLGLNYRLSQQQVSNDTGQPAQIAALIFDRSHNLLSAIDAQAQVVMAWEARNNTRQSWDKSADWLSQFSSVVNSNAPAPNGIYAVGRILNDSPEWGPSFGSHRILIEGGTPTRREILFHSRDQRQQSEIPWQADINDENSRTLGCILLQNPDLIQLAQLIAQTRAPIALVLQGEYGKNLRSPDL